MQEKMYVPSMPIHRSNNLINIERSLMCSGFRFFLLCCKYRNCWVSIWINLIGQKERSLPVGVVVHLHQFVTSLKIALHHFDNLKSRLGIANITGVVNNYLRMYCIEM